MAAQIAETFGVDWPHLAAQVISFAIVCALLYWLAYKPVLAMLETRRQQIAQGIANTEKINAALAAIDGQRQQIIQAAREEAARIVADARAAGERLRAQESARAQTAADRVLERARQQATVEHQAMLADLRREVGHLVIQTTAVVTGRVLSADDQRRLIDETTGRLKAA